MTLVFVAGGLALLTAAYMPFAVISDPVVAGIFALVNTLLNAVTLGFLSRVINNQRASRGRIETAVSYLEEQAQNIAKRRDDSTGDGSTL